MKLYIKVPKNPIPVTTQRTFKTVSLISLVNLAQRQFSAWTGTYGFHKIRTPFVVTESVLDVQSVALGTPWLC